MVKKPTLILETVTVDAPAPADFTHYRLPGTDAALMDHARLAAAICGTPLALIRIGDTSAVWIAPRFATTDQRALLEPALLSLADPAAAPLVVADAPADARLAGHPAVAGTPFLRFFTSLPLPLSPDAMPGVLCVMDANVRQLTSDQADALQALGRRIADDVEQRLSLSRLPLDEARSAPGAFDDDPLSLAGGDDPRSRLNLLQQRMELAIEEAQTSRLLFQQASHRFEELFQGVPVACVCLDEHGLIFEWNRAAEALYGVASERALLKTFWETVCRPEDAALVQAVVMRSLDSQTTQGVEWQYAHPEQGSRVVLCSMFPLRGADGRAVGVISANVDITERKQAQEALMHSERRLREAQKAAKLGSWDYVPQTGHLTCSEELAVILGVEPGAAPQDYDAFLRLIHPTDRPAFDQAVRQAVSAGVPYEFDLRVRARDRSVHYVHATGQPIQGAGGSAAGLFGTMLDITERKRYERELQDQRRQLINANKKLETLATLDGLTGLKNHRAFQEMLEAEFQRFKRHDYPLSLLLLDVDHFKQYNDGYGHPAGDEVLMLLARVLKEQGRTTDFASRYGGEEFAVILPNTDRTGAVAVAERLRLAVLLCPWPARAITASFGAATATRAMGHRTMLVSSADRALYVSKRSGRNCTTHAQQVNADLPLDFGSTSEP